MAEPEHESQHARHRRTGRNRLLAAAIVIIIIIAGAWAILSGGGFTGVTESRSATLTSKPSYFALPTGEYSLALASASKGAGAAYVYVQRLPAFVNPLLNVTVTLNNITTVNSGSAYATMGLTLQSVGTGNATVKITPLDPALHLAPNSSRISVVTTLLSTGRSNVTIATVSTTTSTTTTINQGNVTQNTIKAALAKSGFYAVMLNYTRLYVGTVNCTAGLYNTTFSRYFGTAPSGLSTFYNVSVRVPYAVTNSTASIGSGNYSVTFNTKTVNASLNNAAAMALKVNITGASVYNTVLSGVFTKQTLTSLQNGYKSAVSLGGACGVDVA